MQALSGEADRDTVCAASAARYETWARKRVLGDAPLSARENLVLAQPTPEVPEILLDRARTGGFARVICGFLPDEIDWPDLGRGAAFEFLVERFEFRPLVLEPASTARGTSVVVLCDRSEIALESLATALAEARNETAQLVLTGQTGEAELAEAVTGASLLLDVSADWTLGFAADELATRLGVPVLRLCNPGYSPLRYALLGVNLPLEGSIEVPRLRAALDALGWPASVRRQRTEAESAAGTVYAESSWRNLYTAQTHARLWSGLDLKRLQPVHADEPPRWLNRPAAWTALNAACGATEFSANARRCLHTTVAQWVASEQKHHVAGIVREAALGRWVRLHPEWIETYRHAARRDGERRESLARWVAEAVGWDNSPAPILSTLNAAVCAFGHDKKGGLPIELLRAWAGSWSDVQLAAKELSHIAPAARAAAVASFWSAFCRSDGFATRERNRDALDNLVRLPHIWTLSFAAAGPILRVLAAARGRRLSRARAAVFDVRGVTGSVHLGELARLAQVVYGTEGAILQWLKRLALQEVDELRAAMVRLPEQWLTTRRAGLWRMQVAGNVRRELAGAIRVSRDLAAGSAETAPLATLARLYALDGRAQESCEAWIEAASREINKVEIAWPVTAALWLRGEGDSARRLLADIVDLRGQLPGILFNIALARQFAGDSPGASSALRQLRQTAPSFLVGPSATVGRLTWLAILLKRAGKVSEAERIAARVFAVAPDWRGLYDEIETREEPVAAEWRELSGLVSFDALAG